jgi:hypothetical protein
VILQAKSFSTKHLGLNISRLELFWEFYMSNEDIPEIPDYVEKYGISLFVKQHQFIHTDYKETSKTLFWTHKNKAWDRSTKDKNKKIIIKYAEDAILNGEHELIGKNIDPIIATYIPQELEEKKPYTGMFFP